MLLSWTFSRHGKDISRDYIHGIRTTLQALEASKFCSDGAAAVERGKSHSRLHLQIMLKCPALSSDTATVNEGMRAMLLDGVYRADIMWRALALNTLFLVAGTLSFRYFLRSTRVIGSLLTMGE